MGTIKYNLNIHLLLMLFWCIPAMSQNKILLTLDDFIQQVKTYHPIVLKSSLLIDQSQKQLLVAKAQFDPQLIADQDAKSLGSKNYYTYQHAGLEMATQSPITIKSGYENNNGAFINPEMTVGGMTYLGVEVPLLSGLMIDQRRAALAQSKLFVNQSHLMNQIAVNDLLLEAHIAYWAWAASYQQLSILEKFIINAEERLQLVKNLYYNGDRAVADTIEAALQLDYFRLQVIETKLNYVKETFQLSSFLWKENNIAYILDERYMPDTTAFQHQLLINGMSFEKETLAANPSLKIYNFKLGALRIDRKLKSQYLLPKLDLKALLLRRNHDFPIGDDAFNDYKFGVSLKYPIFARAAKAQLQENKIKSTIVQLDLNQQEWEYSIKLKNLFNEYKALQNQVLTVRDIIFKTTALRDLENVKLSLGESSMFLINSRETKIAESLNKHVDLLLKWHKTKAKIDWMTGSWVSKMEIE